MRIMNEEQMRADVEEFIRTGSTHKDYLFSKWVSSVYMKNLIKEESGWAFPVVAKPPPMIEGIGIKRGMYVDPKPLARIDLIPQSEYDLKDASAGTLYYYQPSTNTLATKLPELMMIRDYMVTNLFNGNPQDAVDVRRFSVRDTKTASDKWHADVEARLARQKVLEFSTLDVGTDYTHISNCNIGSVGYTILRLTSKKALTVESNNMHHCVYTYDQRIFESGKSHTVILSIREIEHSEKPLATIELNIFNDKASIVQMKGTCNEPADIYVPGLTMNIVSILDNLWSNPSIRDALGPLSAPRVDGTQTFTMRY